MSTHDIELLIKRKDGTIELIGATLKRLREARGLSQTKLSSLSGIDRGYISQLESGRRIGISVRTARTLAKSLGVSPSVFLEETLPSKQPIAAILHELSERMELTEVPILGTIPAGYPFPIDEQSEGYVSIPLELLAGVAEVGKIYALRVTGHSLDGDGIADGDLLLIDPGQKSLTDGKIYALRLDNECVVRHAFRQDEPEITRRYTLFKFAS